MKISFNDKSLHTTFEYPSESSLVQEAEAEAQAEAGEEEEDEDEDRPGLNGALEKPFALFLPRATFINSVVPESPRLSDRSSGERPAPGGQWRVPWARVHASTRSHVCLWACRTVQLHSKALRGLQQVAGTGSGTGPQ